MLWIYGIFCCIIKLQVYLRAFNTPSPHINWLQKRFPAAEISCSKSKNTNIAHKLRKVKSTKIKVCSLSSNLLHIFENLTCWKLKFDTTKKYSMHVVGLFIRSNINYWESLCWLNLAWQCPHCFPFAVSSFLRLIAFWRYILQIIFLLKGFNLISSYISLNSIPNSLWFKFYFAQTIQMSSVQRPNVFDGIISSAVTRL